MKSSKIFMLIEKSFLYHLIRISVVEIYKISPTVIVEEDNTKKYRKSQPIQMITI